MVHYVFVVHYYNDIHEAGLQGKAVHLVHSFGGKFN